MIKKRISVHTCIINIHEDDLSYVLREFYNLRNNKKYQL